MQKEKTSTFEEFQVDIINLESFSFEQYIKEREIPAETLINYMTKLKNINNKSQQEIGALDDCIHYCVKSVKLNISQFEQLKSLVSNVYTKKSIIEEFISNNNVKFDTAISWIKEMSYQNSRIFIRNFAFNVMQLYFKKNNNISDLDLHAELLEGNYINNALVRQALTAEDSIKDSIEQLVRNNSINKATLHRLFIDMQKKIANANKQISQTSVSHTSRFFTTLEKNLTDSESKIILESIMKEKIEEKVKIEDLFSRNNNDADCVNNAINLRIEKFINDNPKYENLLTKVCSFLKKEVNQYSNLKSFKILEADLSSENVAAVSIFIMGIKIENLLKYNRGNINLVNNAIDLRIKSLIKENPVYKDLLDKTCVFLKQEAQDRVLPMARGDNVDNHAVRRSINAM